MMLKYTIPALPPSNNRFIGRINYREYQRIKKEWAAVIGYTCRPRPAKPLRSARVRLTYFFPDRRRRDPDNYSGKMILDGLVGAGVLADDSFDNIRLELCGGYDKDCPRTEIEVEEN